MTILVVKFDSYSAAGYLSLAMSTSSTFSTIAMFSMRNYQVSDIKSEFCDSEYLGSRLITCLGAIILCVAYSVGSTSVYQMLCIDAFMLIRLAESAVDVIHGIDQKYNRYDYIGKSFFIRGVVTDVVFISALIVFHDIFFAILLTGIVNLIVVFCYDVRVTNKLEKLQFSLKNRKIVTLLKKCLPIVVTNFLLSMIPLIPKTDIQTIIGNDVLGVYSSIASPTLVVQVFAAYAFNPLIPRISAILTEKRYDQFLKIFHRILVAFFVFAIVICCGAILFGKIGLKLLYGEDILKSYYLFMPLVWCTILTAYIWIMNSIVTVIREIMPMMVAMILGFTICFMFSSSFIQSFGTNGASFIQIICYSITLIILILTTELVIRKRKRDMVIH
jgi:O-antigen/teichoic acid export membrane protein